jgi:hypothetical protein
MTVADELREAVTTARLPEVKVILNEVADHCEQYGITDQWGALTFVIGLLAGMRVGRYMPSPPAVEGDDV